MTALEKQGVGIVSGQGFDTSTFLMAENKPRWWKCPDCKGAGEFKDYSGISGTGFRDCKTCTGKGKVFWLKGDSKGYGWSKN